MFTASGYSRRTVTDMSATQNQWNNLNKPTGFVLIEWFAEFTQSLSGTITNSSTSTSNESYDSVIRGTSTGQDFSFSLISSTYDSTTTESTSNGTSSNASFTGYHTTGLVGVYRNIEGEITSSENTGQTSTVHVNKQHQGSMYDGVACVVYDKTTIDTAVTITSSSSYAITYEGDHADFEVNSYDSSDVTITNGYSTHEYSEVAFDPEVTDAWSLVSYASINTMTSGYSYDEESNFALSQRWTTTGGGSNGSHTYNHDRDRTDTGSFDVTLVEEKYGYSEPDGSGGYSFVFDEYTVTNSYTEDGEYTNVGFAESFGVITAMFFGASTYEHRYDWDKERERDGSGTESISGATSGDTFVYGSYSKSFERDDTGDFFGVHESDATGALTYWALATLIYDETLEYRHTADLDEYEVSIDFAAPWTFTYENDMMPLTTMTGATLETHTDSGEDAKKTPPPPMPLAMSFQETKVGEYYELAAGVIASYGDKPEVMVYTSYAPDDPPSSGPGAFQERWYVDWIPGIRYWRISRHSASAEEAGAASKERARMQDELQKSIKQQIEIEKLERVHKGKDGESAHWGNMKIPRASGADTPYEQGKEAPNLVRILGATILGTALAAGSLFVPGPEDALLLAIAAGKGYRVIRGIIKSEKGDINVTIILNKEGKILSKNEIDALRRQAEAAKAIKGAYGKVGGHHIHAQSGFKGNPHYNPDKAYSISQEYMKKRGWRHEKMTARQRELFRELAASGRPNTIEEHTRIAIESLMAGGVSRAEAEALVRESLENLAQQGVQIPTHIWGK